MGFFSRLFGEEKGPRCNSCRKVVGDRDYIISKQSYLVQVGLSQQARKIENKQGYVCNGCGNIYCKTCLEKRVSNPQTGATCPACGGSFRYLP